MQDAGAAARPCIGHGAGYAVLMASEPCYRQAATERELHQEHQRQGQCAVDHCGQNRLTARLESQFHSDRSDWKTGTESMPVFRCRILNPHCSGRIRCGGNLKHAGIPLLEKCPGDFPCTIGLLRPASI